MSPLAKSSTRAYPYPYPDADGQARQDRAFRVSARAELFIRHAEFVNCYEEENAPAAQRAKFVAQRARRDGAARDGAPDVDESYLAALEWGLPPTGGWGCGVDRLVMYFAGTRRIAECLPFGTLNNVVGLGGRGRGGGRG